MAAVFNFLGDIWKEKKLKIAKQIYIFLNFANNPSIFRVFSSRCLRRPNPGPSDETQIWAVPEPQYGTMIRGTGT